MPSDEVCNCEFSPEFDEPGQPSVWYKRTCEFCGATWAGLHCPHDGYQNPCPECGKRPTVVPETTNDAQR